MDYKKIARELLKEDAHPPEQLEATKSNFTGLLDRLYGKDTASYWKCLNLLHDQLGSLVDIYQRLPRVSGSNATEVDQIPNVYTIVSNANIAYKALTKIINADPFKNSTTVHEADNNNL